MEGRNFQLRSLLAYRVRPPHIYKGGVCFSYHCHFSCFTYCARSLSHHPLTSHEKTYMCCWINNNVVKPNVGCESDNYSWSGVLSDVTTGAELRPHLFSVPSIPMDTSGLNMDKLYALSKFIKLDAKFYIEHDSWTHLFHYRKDKSNFAPGIIHLRHHATNLLLQYANQGITIITRYLPWSQAQKGAVIICGNHPSTQAFT